MISLTEAEVNIAIEDRCTALFNVTWARQPPVLIIHENVSRSRPAPPYVRFFVTTIREDGKQYAGNRIDTRYLALLTAQIFTTKGEGTKMGRSIADVLKAIYEGQQFGGITCREAVLTNVGNDPKVEALYQQNLRIPFDYYHSTTY
jgi:hypothetical protein